MVSPDLHYDLARARADDLRRTADTRSLARRAAQAGAPHAGERSVTLRFGCADDEKALARLAELDSSGPPAQPVLLAEIDGQLLAALALTDGTVVADPFHRTADLIDLLRARARQLDGNRRPRRPFRLRTWSRLRAPAWR